MRHLRTLAVGLTIAILIAACGSNAGESNGPDGNSTEPSAEASTGGGGGGGGANFDNGKAHFEITGAATKSGDLGFLAEYSNFQPQGDDSAILTFTDTDNAASLMINTSANGSVVTYADEELGATLLPVGTVIGECTVTLDEIDSDSAKGSFRCEHIAIVNNGGETIAGEGTLSGTFDAHK
ncbi:MAG TPA: hypothetical protein VFC71_04030 [Candidatus Polarisedimenticolia bacterium]|nr:hypothetical protein [Candidatus Polarisedimenticolia bacterium]